MATRLSECRAGYRAGSFRESCCAQLVRHWSRETPDDFLFDNQILAQILARGYAIAEVTCPTKYFPEASSINFQRSLQYGLGCLANRNTLSAGTLSVAQASAGVIRGQRQRQTRKITSESPVTARPIEKNGGRYRNLTTVPAFCQFNPEQPDIGFQSCGPRAVDRSAPAHDRTAFGTQEHPGLLHWMSPAIRFSLNRRNLKAASLTLVESLTRDLRRGMSSWPATPRSPEDDRAPDCFLLILLAHC